MGKTTTPASQKPRTKVLPTRVTGRVIGWKGKFGWIQPTQPIKHPAAAAKNEGNLYFGREDVEAELSGVGAIVSFFVYQNAEGLGAMNIRPGAAGVSQPAWTAKTTATGKKPTVSTFPGKTNGKAQSNVQAKATPEQRIKVLPTRLTGTVKKWQGNFGWIAPSENINHPAAKMHKGEIFLGREDVEVELSGVGAKVSFFLYQDSNGLGAMHVRPASGGVAPRGSVQKQVGAKAKAAPKIGVKKQSLKDALKQKQKAQQKKDGENDKVNRDAQQPPDKTERKPVSSKLIGGMVVRTKGVVAYIRPDDKIDHPKAQKAKLSLYMHKDDLDSDEFPLVGAKVLFSVYEDTVGLGVESCQVIEQGTGKVEKTPAEEKSKRQRKTGGAAAEANTGDAKKQDLPRKRVSDDIVTGEITKWKNTFGWIKPTEPVEHAGKKSEKIYVNVKDIAEDTSKDIGTLLQFKLYTNQCGFGAEEVKKL